MKSLVFITNFLKDIILLSIGFLGSAFLAEIEIPFGIEWIGIIMLLLIVLFAISLLSRNINWNPKIDTHSLIDKTEQKKEARSGLVIFLSVYTNFDVEKRFTQNAILKAFKELLNEPGNKDGSEINEVIKQKTKEEKEKWQNELDYKISTKDYSGLGLDNPQGTNFGHLIKAIKAHSDSKKLQHLWIISTKSNKEKAATSDAYAEFFKEYVNDEIRREIKVHYDLEKYCIDITEPSLISKNTHDLIRQIYKEAKKKDIKLKPKDIIVDITGGVVSMKLGAVIASLAKDQDVQIIISDYNKLGKVDAGSKSYPVKVGFAPSVEIN